MNRNKEYMVVPIVLGDTVVDEKVIWEKPKTVFLPLKKEVTKKVNNCRELESKKKGK